MEVWKQEMEKGLSGNEKMSMKFSLLKNKYWILSLFLTLFSVLKHVKA